MTKFTRSFLRGRTDGLTPLDLYKCIEIGKTNDFRFEIEMLSKQILDLSRLLYLHQLCKIFRVGRIGQLLILLILFWTVSLFLEVDHKQMFR